MTALATREMTILCLASFEKGHDFLRECKRHGCRVLLLTSLSLKDTAEWPRESIDEIFYMPDEGKVWNRDHTILAVSHLARTEVIERIVPLDDFDLEIAASLRAHLRLPGMGETTTRYFRDKLAMRMKAEQVGIHIPEFVHLLNDDRVREFLGRVPSPWVLKPRSSAGAIGVKKVNDAGELWQLAEALGDQRSFYLLERYIPGDIFHVDSIVYDSQILFAVASQYGQPPLDVSHGGGIFTTQLVERGSDLDRALLETNQAVLLGMGLLRGVSHTEFIRAQEDGKLYFLETSARVGGAHIADLVAAATGLNLWEEWAKIEIVGGNAPYQVRALRAEYAGLLVSLARQESPDMSAFQDKEIVWRMNKAHHIGLIVRSQNPDRIRQLLDAYVDRVKSDHHASAPPQDRASH